MKINTRVFVFLLLTVVSLAGATLVLLQRLGPPSHDASKAPSSKELHDQIATFRRLLSEKEKELSEARAKLSLQQAPHLSIDNHGKDKKDKAVDQQKETLKDPKKLKLEIDSQQLAGSDASKIAEVFGMPRPLSPEEAAHIEDLLDRFRNGLNELQGQYLQHLDNSVEERFKTGDFYSQEEYNKEILGKNVEVLVVRGETRDGIDYIFPFTVEKNPEILEFNNIRHQLKDVTLQEAYVFLKSCPK